MGLVGARLRAAALYAKEQKANAKPRLGALTLEVGPEGVRVFAENDDHHISRWRYGECLVPWDELAEARVNPLIEAIDNVISVVGDK